MHALILSDIHANLEALESVIKDAQRRGGFDVIWCLGDTVGYGPDPGPCIELLRQHDLKAVAGNHDHAVAGRLSTGDFNEAALAAIGWNAQQLTAEAVQFLYQLPQVVVVEPFTLVHGSLRDPMLEYLTDGESAAGTFDLLQTQFCLVGHSHFPFICREDVTSPRFLEFVEGQIIPLGEDRWIVNPGSVGQPRDRDPRSSYAIYDEGQGTLERHRVGYRREDTQAKMRQAGLLQRLIDRLDYGL